MAKNSLEVRINSIEDAKSVVYHSLMILDTVKDCGLDSIEFLIAEEIRHEVDAVIRGVFQKDNYTASVSPRPGNKLFLLPHFPIRPFIPVAHTKSDAVPVPIEHRKRMGRPKGSKNKPKVATEQAAAA